MAKKKSFLAKLLRATVKGLMTEPAKARRNAIRRARRRRSRW